MKYMVNDEGIQALQTMAEKLLDAAEQLADRTVKTLDTVSDKDQVLGPHKASLVDALNAIHRRLKKSTADVNEIANTLDDVADD